MTRNYLSDNQFLFLSGLPFPRGFFERFPVKNSGHLIAGDAPLVKRKPRTTFRDSGRDYIGRYFVISIPRYKCNAIYAPPFWRAFV